jgi:glucose/mannose-6-phosphate isomerase
LNLETLVVCSSYSGNTEETISAFRQAQKAGCNLLVLTRGGKIQELAEDAGVDVWKIGHTGQPRAAVATSFGLLTALFSRVNLIPLQDSDVLNTVKFLEEEKINLDPDAPISKNAAKRLAGQLYGRIVGIVGSDLMAPVAVRWAGQINELAKGWSQALTLPEMDHNSLAGILNPAGSLTNLAVVFINSKFDHPRNQLRSELTRKIFMLEGVNTDFFNSRGVNELDQLWSAIQFGDYVAYYLAMMYEIDPTPIPAIEQLKIAMKG